MTTWRIDSGAQTLVLAQPDDGGIACCIWWGPALPADEYLATLAQAAKPGISGGMLDELPPLSLCPEMRRSFPGQPGLVAYDLDGEAAMLAEMQIVADGSRFVIFAARTDSPDPVLPAPLRLTGLNPAARYRLRMIETPPGHHRAHTALCQGPVTLSGAAWMAAGVMLPCHFPQTIAVIEGERL